MSAVPAAVQAQLDRSKALEAQAGGIGTEQPVQNESPDNWQQKYAALQGKYNAEVPRLAEDLKRLKGELEKANGDRQRHQEELAQMQAAANSAQQDSTLKQLEDDYDPDGVVAMLKSLRTENTALQAKLASMAGDVGQLKSTEQVRAENVQEAVRDEVRKAVSNIEAIEADPAFNQWCHEIDEHAALISGVRKTRQQVFDEIMQTARPETLHSAVRRAVGLYQQWGRDKGAVQQPLQSQLSPADTASAAPSGSAGPRWGPRSSQQFYKDRMGGKYRGRDAEAAELDRSLTTAVQEGRWDPRL